MLNYPFVYPSAEDNAPDVFKNMGAAPYPRSSTARRPRRRWAASTSASRSYSENKEESFDAIQCLIQPENQIEIARAGGLPPVREALFDRRRSTRSIRASPT